MVWAIGAGWAMGLCLRTCSFFISTCLSFEHYRGQLQGVEVALDRKNKPDTIILKQIEIAFFLYWSTANLTRCLNPFSFTKLLDDWTSGVRAAWQGGALTGVKYSIMTRVKVTMPIGAKRQTVLTELVSQIRLINALDLPGRHAERHAEQLITLLRSETDWYLYFLTNRK